VASSVLARCSGLAVSGNAIAPESHQRWYAAGVFFSLPGACERPTAATIFPIRKNGPCDLVVGTDDNCRNRLNHSKLGLVIFCYISR
jgi:hypothetical protein